VNQSTGLRLSTSNRKPAVNVTFFTAVEVEDEVNVVREVGVDEIDDEDDEELDELEELELGGGATEEEDEEEVGVELELDEDDELLELLFDERIA
jgi:hypothetical protein